MAFSLGRKRPYIQADGGISHERPMPAFSIIRLAILAVLFGWLAVTNTENKALRTWLTVVRPLQKETAAPLNNNYYSTYESRRSTNYGLFHVKERILNVVINVAGQEWSCYYDEPVYGDILCREILRDQLCHEMPLWEGDIVYRLHRAVTMMLILSTCLAACMTTPIHLAAADSSLIPNAIVSLFVDEQVRLAPVPILIQRLLSWNVFCYPALKAMHRTIEHQNGTSFFRTNTDTPDMGFFLSASLVFVMAVFLNALSTFWNGSFLLQFEAISGILVGFHAKYRAAMMGGDILFHGITWSSATWTLLASLIIQQSVATAAFWCLGHLLGQTLGKYLLDHYVSSLTVQRMIEWLNW